MSKYRLVRKRKAGYEYYYEIQQRVLGLFWVMKNWSVSYDVATKAYNRMLSNSKCPAEFCVLRED